MVFVLGAGCSFEPPTNLKLASQLAIEVHDRLVGDGILESDECEDPEDLEALVDLISSKEGLSKADVVIRMPRDKFRNAQANLGHRVLVALLQERLAGNVLTLNFDLALGQAVTSHQANEVTTVRSPAQHCDLGSTSVIYLHGNVDSPEQEWVLTSAEVAESWEGGWRDIVASRVLTAPTVVFAGVGTLVGVLLGSIRRIRDAIPDQVEIYQVDPTACEESNVFDALEIPEQNYIQVGWCDFAEALGRRVNRHHLDAVRRECDAQFKEHREDLAGHLSQLLDSLSVRGLLHFGQLRALWFLEHVSYLPWKNVRLRWIADLIGGAVRLANQAGAEFLAKGDRHLTLRTADGRQFQLGCVHGRGEIRWAELDARVSQFGRYHLQANSATDLVLVAGVVGSPLEDLSPPRSLINDRPGDDVVTAGCGPSYLDVDSVPEGMWGGLE